MQEKAADKMQDLIKIKGFINIDGMKFHDIEGGFGKDKKSMVAKEIANIHRRDLKDINRNINNNIKRFKKGIDIVDLKNGGFDSLLKELGFSNRDISISKNIYLLSERGYSKLLKILEDDVAWEKYEKLVDGYFNMRSNKSKPLTPLEQLHIAIEVIKEHEEKLDNVDSRVNKLENNVTIDHGQACNIKLSVDLTVKKLCQGSESYAYQDKLLRRKVYQFVWRSLKDYFNVTAYHNILRKDIESATKYISNLGLQGTLLREVQRANNQMCFGEVQNG